MVMGAQQLVRPVLSKVAGWTPIDAGVSSDESEYGGSDGVA